MDDKPIMSVKDGVHSCERCIFVCYDRPGAIQHLTEQHRVKEWLMDPDGYVWADAGIPAMFRRWGAV